MKCMWQQGAFKISNDEFVIIQLLLIHCALLSLPTFSCQTVHGKKRFYKTSFPLNLVHCSTFLMLIVALWTQFMYLSLLECFRLLTLNKCSDAMNLILSDYDNLLDVICLCICIYIIYVYMFSLHVCFIMFYHIFYMYVFIFPFFTKTIELYYGQECVWRTICNTVLHFLLFFIFLNLKKTHMYINIYKYLCNI